MLGLGTWSEVGARSSQGYLKVTCGYCFEGHSKVKSRLGRSPKIISRSGEVISGSHLKLFWGSFMIISRSSLRIARKVIRDHFKVRRSHLRVTSKIVLKVFKDHFKSWSEKYTCSPAVSLQSHIHKCQSHISATCCQYLIIDCELKTAFKIMVGQPFVIMRLFSPSTVNLQVLFEAIAILWLCTQYDINT